MKWPLVRLGDVCEIVSGATPSTSVSDYWDGEHYWATPKDLSDLRETYIEKTSRRITKKGLDSCAAAVLPINSVLFSSRAPIGLVAINRVPMATNQGFKSFVPRYSVLDSKFLFHWLKYSRPHIEAMGVGATFKEVSKSIVEKIQIPLPPLAEQQRIATLLDTADNLLRLREAAITKLDQLALSAFNKIQHTTTEKARIDRVFEINNNRIVNGIKDEDLVSFVPMSAVSEKTKRIEIHNVKKFLDVKKGYTPIRKGDLIIAKITPCYENGKMAIADNLETEIGFGSTEFHTIRCENPSLTLFAYYFLQRENIRFAGAKNMKGAAGQRRVPADFFAELEIPLPNAKHLNEFSEQISSIQRRREVMELSQKKLSDLKKSIEHQSFAVN